MDASRFEVQRLDHLGLVSGFCKEIGLEELINQRMPSHINEDVMGRFLGSLYEQGVSELYQEIACMLLPT